MSLSKYRKSEIQINIDKKDSFKVRGLTLEDIINLTKNQEELITYIFDGIDLSSNESIYYDLISKAPDLIHLVIAMCSDDDDALPHHVKDLPILTQMQAFTAILEQTLPEEEDLEDNLKKLIAEILRIRKLVTSVMNKKK